MKNAPASSLTTTSKFGPSSTTSTATTTTTKNAPTSSETTTSKSVPLSAKSSTTSTTTTQKAAPATPTLGRMNCKTYLASYASCWLPSLVNPSLVNKTISAMVVPDALVDSTMNNITQVLPGAVFGAKVSQGLQYMVNIAWVPGCTAVTSQNPRYPMGNTGDNPLSYEAVLWDTFDYCMFYSIQPCILSQLLYPTNNPMYRLSL